ncbi:GNAT family N-acetyltransferase [Streptomyces sp. DT171]|uniref:GNAT family N-acetyltransferase n=1 Tax=Streptomyces sp. DT171 TaxID=3416524 RepID=UPI003CEE425A
MPIAAAVSSEMRHRGLLTEKRPSRLTPEGLALVAELGMDLSLDATCLDCGGREIVIPPVLDEAVRRLAEIMETGPGADMALDQSRCTPETKVRRVLALLRAGVLPGGSLLLVGDDDMVSLAVAVVGDVLGSPLVERLTVLDISPEILGHINEVAAGHEIRIDTVEHDLRRPIPDHLRDQFDVAMTDPPYTPEGARLFLSRAVEGLRPGAAHSVFFSFGAKNPNEMLEVQREILSLGLVTNGFIHNFNEYEGSGILGGSGFFQHLLTTSATESPLEAEYGGPLYTRDKRSRQREYECVSCQARFPVGPGAEWTSVGALRANGCPRCGGGPFKPRQLVSMTEPGESPAPEAAPPVASPESAPSAPAVPVQSLPPVRENARGADGFVVRSAGSDDLDTIASFETEIAKVSFGDDAIDDPQRHRARLGRAMQKSRAGMYVACDPSGAVVGWLWMSINKNTMTSDQYANVRSLAVSPVERRTEVAELLIATGLDFADEHQVGEVTGRVYSGNLPMRALYEKFGFDVTHMAMRLRLPNQARPVNTDR